MSYGFGLGIVSIMILFGIIVSGSYIELVNTSSNNPEIVEQWKDINYLPPNFDQLLIDLDNNVTNQVNNNFQDANISPAAKKVVYYITKGAIAGIYTDIYMGKTVNEYFPDLYSWIKNNMYLVIAGVIILMYPQVISLLIICIFAGILIIEERFFDKPDKKPKNTWRDKN